MEKKRFYGKLEKSLKKGNPKKEIPPELERKQRIGLIKKSGGLNNGNI